MGTASRSSIIYTLSAGPRVVALSWGFSSFDRKEAEMKSTSVHRERIERSRQILTNTANILERTAWSIESSQSLLAAAKEKVSLALKRLSERQQTFAEFTDPKIRGDFGGRPQ